MVCSLPHTVKEFKAYVQRQCDEDDATRQEAIMGVITLFDQPRAAKEDLRKQYVECKDISLEKRDLIDIFFDDEAWKDHELKNVSGIIVHWEPFLELKMVHSMLTSEEMRLKSRDQATSIDSTSSSPMVLLTNSGNTTRRPPVASDKLNKPCFNFNKGFCYFGEHSQYEYNGTIGLGRLTIMSRTAPSVSNVNIPNVSLKPMVMHAGLNNYPQLVSHYTGTHGFSTPIYGPSPIGNQSAQPIQHANVVSSHLGSFQHIDPSSQTGPCELHCQPAQQASSGPNSKVVGRPGSTQARYKSLLPNAFNAMTLQDDVTGNWNMDTSAISHLNDSIFGLTVEFDAFGFSIKDFMTRRVLLRCDNTEDLYLVTKPSTIPYASHQSIYLAPMP
ncbi:hypothetical protein Tco_0246928 [Tanacetum coccineum]